MLETSGQVKIKSRTNNPALMLFLFGAIFSISCNDNSNNSAQTTIKVDLSDSVKAKISIDKIIPLETLETSLFVRVKRISIIDSLIFILDDRGKKSLLAFDINGQWIKALTKGRGPGEVMRPVDFYIDKEQNTIMLYDAQTMRFSTYDYNLDLREARECPNFFLRSFTRLEDKRWLLHYQTNLAMNDSIYSYLLYSQDFTTCTDTLLPDIYEHKSMMLNNSISREGLHPLFCRPRDQNIYTLFNGQLRSQYYIDFGPLNITDDLRKRGQSAFLANFREGKVVTMVGNPINTNEYFACTFSTKGEPFYFVYSKKAAKVVLTTDRNILPYGQLKCSVNDNTFVLVVDPDDFIDFYSDKTRELPTNYTIHESDNPVLVFFTIEEIV